MKAILTTLLLIAWTAAAAEPVAALSAAQAGAPAMQGIARSAQEALERATRELNELRAEVAADKVPLAEELAKWEDQLVQGRRREAPPRRPSTPAAVSL